MPTGWCQPVWPGSGARWTEWNGARPPASRVFPSEGRRGRRRTQWVGSEASDLARFLSEGRRGRRRTQWVGSEASGLARFLRKAGGDAGAPSVERPSQLWCARRDSNP